MIHCPIIPFLIYFMARKDFFMIISSKIHDSDANHNTDVFKNYGAT